MTCQIMRSMDVQKLLFCILILVWTLLVGCAVVPQPSLDVYIEPIEGRHKHKNSS